jgi:succinate-semialdehyde dehydrogenase/glutarate-semialdehyde dehydrogenase
MYEKRGLFIGGEWNSTGANGRAVVIDPATEDVLGQVPLTSVQDAERAIEAAESGLKRWRDAAAWCRSMSLAR